jgi:uncharacterized membrane protein YczE
MPAAARTAATWPVSLRFLLLNAGLALYGLGLSLMIAAGVGLAPWDALHVGLARVIPGLSVGGASIAVGLLFLAVSARFLGMPVGVGSALNMLLIGLYIDALLPRLPTAPGPFLAWTQFGAGIALVGLATGTYIASGFGAGPRDGLVLGLAGRTGWPVRYLRVGVELAVLAAGFLMGAKVGWGTLVFALAIGPAMSAGLGLYGLRR